MTEQLAYEAEIRATFPFALLATCDLPSRVATTVDDILVSSGRLERQIHDDGEVFPPLRGWMLNC